MILGGVYEQTKEMWREEMKNGLMIIVSILSAIFFVLLYALLVESKGTGTGVKFGLLFGLATGISMGYGSYSVMAIPYSMALTWFLGSVVEATVAGWLMGLIFKEKEAKAAPAA